MYTQGTFIPQSYHTPPWPVIPAPPLRHSRERGNPHRERRSVIPAPLSVIPANAGTPTAKEIRYSRPLSVIPA